MRCLPQPVWLQFYFCYAHQFIWPNDNYHPENSHVLAALLRKFIIAEKQQHPFVEIWGTGTPRREFLHVDDLADACYFLMQNYNDEGAA